MTRVLVVEDSPTMRGLIVATLRREPRIQVVGAAANAAAAREAIKALNPDVLTLDVEMPGMDGLSFLEKLMRLRPMPVVMVSSCTARGAEATVQALALGAIECVEKPSPAAPNALERLPATVLAASRAIVRATGGGMSGPVASPAARDYRPDGRIVALGASTGGVEALLSIVSAFPANCPPTVITQHMPPSFTRSFAERLDRASAAVVREAEDGARLRPGHVFLAPGGEAHLEVVGGLVPKCRLRRGDRVSGHCPSVDVLFGSLATAVGPAALGVILTGMGRDGAAGLLAMRQAGAATLGQDEASSVVYGMPRAAQELGAVERQLSLGRIGAAILEATASDRKGAH